MGLAANSAAAACIAVAIAAVFAVETLATEPPSHLNRSLKSATQFLSPELAAEQADDARNRGLLWVEQGATLWHAPADPGGTPDGASCRTCHQEAEATMRGVAARMPVFDVSRGRVLNLEGRINVCRTEKQRNDAWAYESPQLLAMTAYLSFQSRGMPKSATRDWPDTASGSGAPSGPAQNILDRGRTLWNERQGQFNLSCAQCHDDNVGRKLRGDTISSAVPTGYPAYRLEWDGLGSLHRRLRACQLGVRAVQFEHGSEEYLALEVYLAWRATGQLIEAPAIRR